MKSWKSWQKIAFGIGIGLFVIFGLPFVIRGARAAWSYAFAPTAGGQQDQLGYQPTDQQPYSVNPTEENPVGTNVPPGPVRITVTNGNENNLINYGTYESKYDKYNNRWNICLDQDYLVGTADKNLADIKREGGTLTFIMPANGWINNSAGTYLMVGNNYWTFGNYAEGSDAFNPTYIIPAGTPVTVNYQANNPSAGFALVFDN